MKVGIIGAGIGGLTVGRNLAQAGLKVEIFDKGRGPGGRVSSKRTEYGGVDFGAQFLTCQSETFKLQIEKWGKEGIVVPLSESSSKILKTPGNFEDKIEEKSKYQVKPKMSSIARSLAEGQNIKYEILVDQVSKNENQSWKLSTKEGKSFGEYDWLIINCPPAQALKFIEHSASLNEKVKREVYMDPCWAVSLTFQESLGIQVVDTEVQCSDIIDYISNNSAKPERTAIPETWIIHGAALWCQEHLEDSFDSIGTALENEFFRILNISPKTVLKRIVHRWRFSRAAKFLTEGYLIDETNKIAICGDWCNGDSVEDAYLSGSKLSDYLLSRSSNLLNKK